ncbi:MAG: zinc finger domain-containing protein [Candidatus Aenigmarchaeota archaeon]|nr:zinc finger domain-containing protein [Candidatus Aenigmarchaeota archaeon]
MKCTSCGLNLLGDDRYVRFKCPKCAKVEIFRCSQCKRLSNEYLCPSCGFKGP